jgi:hypothetical protein
MPDDSLNSSQRPSAGLIVVLLLAAAHLPFVFVQCRTLWSLEHYQFFPFSFVVFGWLFQSRRVVGVYCWDAICSLLIVADVILLTTGSLNNSPLTVYTGALLLCLAVCRASADSGANLRCHTFAFCHSSHCVLRSHMTRRSLTGCRP